MVVASFAEVISISAILPFLGALVAPDRFLNDPRIRPVLVPFDVRTPAEGLRVITSLFVVAVMTAGCIRMVLLWMTTRVTFSLGEDLSTQMYRCVLCQPYTYIATKNTSDLIGAISIKANGVVYNTILPSLNIVSSVFVTTTVMAALVYIDPMIATATFLGFTLIYGVMICVSRLRLAIDSRHIASATNRVVKALQEGFGGIRDILIDGTQDTYCRIFGQSTATLRRAQGNSVIISQAPRYIVEALGTIMIAVLAYLVASRGAGVARLFPMFGALALGAQRLLPAIQQIYSGWSSIESSKTSLADVLDILELPIDEAMVTRSIRPIAFNTAITIRQLSFRYTETGPWVLRGINLSVPRGSRLGIIGATGSGKSTLIDLLMGLLRPTEGLIEIDGASIAGQNVRSWQAHVAHVPQNIFLADTTIEKNIAFGVPAASINVEAVRFAAEQAQLAATIEAWPDQYKTMVGERGMRLSGGQRQRIGIARALYKSADVLIFDEATSALDNETEHALMDAVASLGETVTIVMIAHRLTSLRECDSVVEIEEGKIRRIGTYEEMTNNVAMKRRPLGA
jgi:ATP-binding cassette subfamily B protein